MRFHVHHAIIWVELMVMFFRITDIWFSPRLTSVPLGTSEGLHEGCGGSIEADLDQALGVASSMFLQWFFESVLLDGLLLRSSVTIVALEFVEILIGYLFVLSSISNMISGY